MSVLLWVVFGALLWAPVVWLGEAVAVFITEAPIVSGLERIEGEVFLAHSDALVVKGGVTLRGAWAMLLFPAIWVFAIARRDVALRTALTLGLAMAAAGLLLGALAASELVAVAAEAGLQPVPDARRRSLDWIRSGLYPLAQHWVPFVLALGMTARDLLPDARPADDDAPRGAGAAALALGRAVARSGARVRRRRARRRVSGTTGDGAALVRGAGRRAFAARRLPATGRRGRAAARRSAGGAALLPGGPPLAPTCTARNDRAAGDAPAGARTVSTSADRAARRFLVGFGVASAVLLALGEVGALDAVLRDPVQWTLAWLTTAVLDLARFDCTQYGSIIQCASATVDVARGCDGYEVLACFSAAVVAFPKQRWVPQRLLAGVALLFAANWLRVIALTLVVAWAPDHFEAVHQYGSLLWLVAIATGLWWWWGSAAAEPAAPTPEPAPARKARAKG